MIVCVCAWADLGPTERGGAKGGLCMGTALFKIKGTIDVAKHKTIKNQLKFL